MTDIIKRQQRFITGRNNGLHEVQQVPGDYDPKEGLLYAKRPGERASNSFVNSLFKTLTIFKRSEGKKMADHLMGLYKMI
uniref:Transposase n=1 Tax=Globodera pallida TaxID=36090 RepID=A0A183BS30_GLOPA